MKIALIQFNSSASMQENAEKIIPYIIQAKEGGAKHIFTPENSDFILSDAKEALQNAGTEDNHDFVKILTDIAKKLEIYVHIGSVKYRLTEGKMVNRSVSLSPQGYIIASYDKIHLFDAVVGDGEIYRESDKIQAGKMPTLLHLPEICLGYSICYDVRFPELYQKLALAGADVIAVPAAFTVPTGKAHWHSLLRARAIETGCYIVAAAQCGDHDGGRKTFGHSLAVSPWGEILCEMTENKAGVIFLDYQPEKVKEARRAIPSLQHRIVMSEIKTYRD